MGLTIHYRLHADTASADEARRLVEQLREKALDLPFQEVGELVDLGGDRADPNPLDRGEPLDANHSLADISPDTLARIEADCRNFQRDNAADIGPEFERAGHDFWLTRNHHGAGFWDGDWPHDASERLTAASHAAGEFGMHIGDDGLLHG